MLKLIILCVTIYWSDIASAAKCGQNEEYSSCANAGCEKRNCSQLTQPVLCIDVIAGRCRGRCVCVSGYLRNAAGKCVPIDECPIHEVCPNPNEYLDKCSTNCPDDECGIGVIPTFVPCTRPSNPADCVARCRCKQGYQRDSNGRCVAPEDCPPQCGLNEVPSDCANNGCLSTCAQPDLIARCTPDLSYCQPGCVCADGYLPDDNGVCVPSDQCPPKSDVCSLPPETGPCRASITKYYYNPSKKDCIAFTYGGCRGNKNNFDTKEECLQKCSSNKY